MIKKLFGSKKTRKQSRPRTDEQIEKAQARKEKQWAREKLLKKFDDNPELENKYIAKLMGIEIPSPDPIEVKKKEIEAKITEEAFQQVNEDPELRRRYTEKLIEEIVGEATEKEGEEYPPGSAVGQVLEELDTYEELKERFGAKTGPLGGLINAELLTELAKQAPTILSILQGKQPPPPPTTYVVEVNGQMREMDAAGYKQLLEQRELKRLEAARKPEPKLEETKPVVEPKMEEPKPELGLDLTLLTDYLDGEPISFIDSLIELQQNDSPEAIFILNLMSESDSDRIIEMLQPLKTNEEYKGIIERLEQKQRDEGWLQVSIDYYRSFSEEMEGTQEE